MAKENKNRWPDKCKCGLNMEFNSTYDKRICTCGNSVRYSTLTHEFVWDLTARDTKQLVTN